MIEFFSEGALGDFFAADQIQFIFSVLKTSIARSSAPKG